MRRTVLALCMTVAFTNPNVYATVSAEAPEQTKQTLLAASSVEARGDFAVTAEPYRKAAERDPSIPELWPNLGLMDQQIGKSSKAIRTLKRAIRLNPSLWV